MLNLINLNSNTQSDFGWIFLDAVLHTDYETEEELNAFLGQLNADWLIISRSDTHLAPEACLMQAFGDVLENHINSKKMAESCHQTLTLKWIFHRKTPLPNL